MRKQNVIHYAFQQSKDAAAIVYLCVHRWGTFMTLKCCIRLSHHCSSTEVGFTHYFLTGNYGLHLNILSLLTTYGRDSSDKSLPAWVAKTLSEKRLYKCTLFPSAISLPDLALTPPKHFCFARNAGCLPWRWTLGGAAGCWVQNSWLWNVLPHRGAKIYTWKILNTMAF